MALGALNKLCGTSMEITESKYDDLVRESEQLRILKRFAKLEEVYCKEQITTLIKAMEESNE